MTGKYHYFHVSIYDNWNLTFNLYGARSPSASRANSDMKISPIIITANVLATVPLSAAFSPSQSGNASIHKKRQSKVSKTSLDLSPAMFVRGGGDVVLKNFYGDALGERYYTMINMNICCLVC